MAANVFYNRVMRKIVVGFGNLFDNLTLVRYNSDNSEAERFIVPIAYAAKELYVQRLQGDPNLDKKVQMTLPRLSYEMMGIKYDTARKQNTNIRNFASTTNAGVVGQFNPVPYDYDFNLYLYVRNIEDGTQLIEHILSYFTPDYTIKLNLIPEMGIVKEIPIVLNSATHETEYEGDRDSDTRTIIWTLNFTAKGFIYGPISDSKIIKASITNIYNEIGPNDIVEFTVEPTSGIGDYQIGEVVYQGYSKSTATATAKVAIWSNNVLQLTNISGNFVSSHSIRGETTNANYTFTSYNLTPRKYVTITTVPNPLNVNVANNYIANTTIQEFN
jgi:hypothetical protein